MEIAKQKRLTRKASLRKIFNNILEISYIEHNSLTKKQIKLLRALSTLNDVSVKDLERKTKSTNIKSLVRDTNIRIHKLLPKEALQIVSSYRERALKGYYRLDLSLSRKT